MPGRAVHGSAKGWAREEEGEEATGRGEAGRMDARSLARCWMTKPDRSAVAKERFEAGSARGPQPTGCSGLAGGTEALDPTAGPPGPPPPGPAS